MEITKTHYRENTEKLSTLLRQISCRITGKTLATGETIFVNNSKMREIENNLKELNEQEN